MSSPYEPNTNDRANLVEYQREARKRRNIGKNVLGFLRELSLDAGADGWVRGSSKGDDYLTIAELADRVGASVRSGYRWTTALEKAGYIETKIVVRLYRQRPVWRQVAIRVVPLEKTPAPPYVHKPRKRRSPAVDVVSRSRSQIGSKGEDRMPAPPFDLSGEVSSKPLPRGASSGAKAVEVDRPSAPRRSELDAPTETPPTAPPAAQATPAPRPATTGQRDRPAPRQRTTEGKEHAPDHRADVDRAIAAVTIVWAKAMCEYGRPDLSRLDGKNRGAIANRVRDGATVETLCAAAVGGAANEYVRTKARTTPFAIVFATRASVERFASEGWPLYERQKAKARGKLADPIMTEVARLLGGPKPENDS